MLQTILDLIVVQKHREIDLLLKKTTEGELQKKAVQQRSFRPFLKRLQFPGHCGGINIIAEIKRASPSRGDICPDLDPAAYARQYEIGGAACLSVLTDRQFFKGSNEDLKIARAATDLPVLRKDFLISACQVYESCILGADAVLLIARILSPDELKSLFLLCHDLGMDALVEVHSEQDIDSAIRSGARLIGINNRDLMTFQTDISMSSRLVSLLNPEQILVAASGIQNRDDIDHVRQSGIFNFLIGESLVRSADPSAFLKGLHDGNTMDPSSASS